MMAALNDDSIAGQSKAGSPQQATRTVLPVVLMEFDAVITAYQQHWQRGTFEDARDEGFSPATVADLRRLLEYGAIRQEQVRLPGL